MSHPGTVGRLSQVCDRWIYTCLCFGLDLDEQERGGFRYAYSVYQAEYSRNPPFADGAVMDRVFNAVVDRTRARLDVPLVRTLFPVKHRPPRREDAKLPLASRTSAGKASRCCASKRSPTAPAHLAVVGSWAPSWMVTMERPPCQDCGADVWYGLATLRIIPG